MVGHQHTYLNQGILKSFHFIYKEEGLKGLYRGVDASMVRTGVGSAVQLSCYDVFKSKIQPWFSQENALQVHFLASLLTSFFVCIAMNTFDVASTRMYNQKSLESNKKAGALYKNGLDCIHKTIKAEGLSALYKGFTAHYLRIGPHTILTFLFLEQGRKLFTHS